MGDAELRPAPRVQHLHDDANAPADSQVRETGFGSEGRHRWGKRLDNLRSDPDQLALVMHPVVDVVAGRVAGYEVLSRFAAPQPTEAWFLAARTLERSAELDGLVLRAALPLRARLPHGTFLTVNASPTSLCDPEVMRTLLQVDLTGVVVEITEHSECAPADLVEPLARLRARGAKIALDDVGTGHSGLLRMAVARPEMVKVDLQLVRGLESDLVKRSLVQFLGECAARLDAWIVAEGVETAAELDVLRGMGVPLVQGFLLARPAAGFAQLDAPARDLLREATPVRVEDAPRRSRDLTRRTPTARSISGALRRVVQSSAPVVVVDAEDVPRVMVLPGQGRGQRPRVQPVEVTLAPETTVSDAATRAVARSPAVRFDPLVCTDASGRYVGLVGVEDMIMDLARGPVDVRPRWAHRGRPWAATGERHIGGDIQVPVPTGIAS
ncbi:MAG: EAL domain-containing protein [Janthinobacterium lividum]